MREEKKNFANSLTSGDKQQNDLIVSLQRTHSKPFTHSNIEKCLFHRLFFSTGPDLGFPASFSSSGSGASPFLKGSFRSLGMTSESLHGWFGNTEAVSIQSIPVQKKEVVGVFSFFFFVCF